MGVFFYNIFLALFKAGVHIASLFNGKAAKWVRGRKGIFEKLEAAIPENEKIIWMHCASLGEFEQGRPLLEKLRVRFPGYKFLLTFFSPSGYEVQKDYRGADWVFYLPADGARNAKRFLEIVRPSLVIFVKYEFWYYYLKKIKYREMPLLLVSALFRREMSFFQWYGALQRKMLSRFDHLFVQNESSKALMDEIGLSPITSISGDTRFDRVAEIADKFEVIPIIEYFIGDKKALIAGSTWKEDEEILQSVFNSLQNRPLKLIIAPHEINSSHIQDIQKLFPGALLFSVLKSKLEEAGLDLSKPINWSQIESARVEGVLDAPVLIIDNIGMLSRLYRYAYITFVGGAFRKSGVHNVLEAAVHGKPVLYGPEYTKYYEAIQLIESGGGACVHTAEECTQLVQALLDDEKRQAQYAERSREYVRKNRGATEKIIQFIQEKRLLTI